MILISCSKTRDGDKVWVGGIEILETQVVYGEAWVKQLKIVYTEFVNTWSYSEQFEALFALGFACGQVLMILWDQVERYQYPNVSDRVPRFKCETPGWYEFLHVVCVDPLFWTILFKAMLRLGSHKGAHQCTPNGATHGDTTPLNHMTSQSTIKEK